MNTQIAPRLGAASGLIFAVVLFAGSGHSSPGQVVRELVAVVVFLPFLAYLCSVLREAEGPHGWLTTTAFAAGLAGITIKLLTGMPVIALQRVPSGTPLHSALDDMSSASTVISLYPFAVMLASVAVLIFRTNVLPRSLAFGAAAAAAALAAAGVYGTFTKDLNVGPALMVWVLWTLITSIVLLRRTRNAARNVAYST